MGSRAASWALTSAPRGLLVRAMPDMHAAVLASETGARVPAAHPPTITPTTFAGLHSCKRSLSL